MDENDGHSGIVVGVTAISRFNSIGVAAMAGINAIGAGSTTSLV